MADLIYRDSVVTWLETMGHPKLAQAIADTERFQTHDELHEFEKMLCKAFEENNGIITEDAYNELINKAKMDGE